MQLTSDSELMKNQKHADVMAPDSVFQVLQATTGDALFFSIGTDNVFYITREQRETTTGWTRVDLSSVLSSQYGGAAITAKSFSVAQNAQTQAFDIVLVVTVSNSDYLHYSLGNSADPSAWAAGISWTAARFDAAGKTQPSPMTIADIMLLQFSSDVSVVTECCFVDIIRTPGDPLKLLDRYYILPGAFPQWYTHTLAVDLSAGSVSNCLGIRTGDFVGGIYTVGSISSTQEVLFTPQYNYFNKNVAPTPASLPVPSGASAIASALNGNGVSNLFVVGSNGLYVFTPDNQHGKASVQVISTVVFAGTLALSAATFNSTTAVWGVNAQGDLYHTSCPAGSAGSPSAWSSPTPLLSGVDNFAFYLNLNQSNNVLFAHTSGQQLVQLMQDPVSTIYTQRNILLPATAIDDMLEYNSYTSTVTILGDNGVPAPNTAVTLTSTSMVPVYVDNVYHVLSPMVPVNVTCDATGILTVVQETQSLSAVCFRVTLASGTSIFVDVNPMSKAIQRLSSIQSGTDLGNVQVTAADGSTHSLVPSTASADDKNNAATAIQQLVQAVNSLPADGSTVGSQVTSMVVMSKVVAKQNVALSALSVSGINLNPGDIFGWVNQEWNNVTNFVVQKAGEAWQFICAIAGEVYTAAIDCIGAVAGAIKFVFDKLQVAFDDLVAYLGFLFNWSDIVRTHKVIKNVVNFYVQRAINSISSLEVTITNAFTNLEAQINSFGGLPDPGQTMQSQSTLAQSSGFNSPQATWALHQTKSNMDSASSSYTPPGASASGLAQIGQSELATFQAMGGQISALMGNLFNLTPTQIVKQLLAIFTDVLLNSAENLILSALNIFQTLVSDLAAALNAPINIPVISSVYKSVAGDDLSFMDLICLVGAIPATIGYKVVTGKVPFPDNSTTTALINAPDFATIHNLLTSGGQQSLVSNKQVLSIGRSMAVASSLSTLEIVESVLNWAAAPAAMIVAWFNDKKRAGGELSTPIKLLSFFNYLVYVSPNFPSAPSSSVANWGLDLNDAMTGAAIIKTGLDGLIADVNYQKYGSPILECVINAAWLVAACAEMLQNSDPQTTDWLSFGSNVCFDTSGILTPFASPDIMDPEIAAVVYTMSQILTVAYGLLCGATGIAFDAQ
ncbi:hypothetical protein M422DRAFT_245944 [Sphaerobolus stellatus SS14]|nr:hypothetical protein M422DRAFT_245944 [Sphaerobolus stellatus SS14]